MLFLMDLNEYLSRYHKIAICDAATECTKDKDDRCYHRTVHMALDGLYARCTPEKCTHSGRGHKVGIPCIVLNKERRMKCGYQI
jgi:hypothetical protein